MVDGTTALVAAMTSAGIHRHARCLISANWDGSPPSPRRHGAKPA